MSLLPGVYKANKKNGELYYRSSITFRNKHISLGSFRTEVEAHSAYKEASSVLRDSLHTIQMYEQITPTLSFAKWITLINFRDNNLYIKTPIYLKNKYFLYYINSSSILTFDVDDLFYYSNHSILKRGGHLFVCDYGMQVNILSRYGIKNFAVEERDYQFMNGNSSDYRYHNIKIINRYFGVTQFITKGVTQYLVKIHIHGDYIVGRYSNEIEAAIAYNKAAEQLMQKGLEKAFPLNYVEEVDSKTYHSIYKTIPISQKIVRFDVARK